MIKEYKYLGTNDDKNDCCLCGKESLKKVIWLENTTTGKIAWYGSSCGAKLMNITSEEFKDWIRSESMEKIYCHYVEMMSNDSFCRKIADIIKKELKTNKITKKDFNDYLKQKNFSFFEKGKYRNCTITLYPIN